ncbi:MAG: CPBP family intramembrane metalloprotease [Clostridiales bacterium]|nr:CPBP family intramembrane metalloprotease [Clostridiales bacterium]
MQQLSCQHKLKPWMGFALFAAVMAFMVFVSGYIQKAWELAGLAVTEVFFLVLSIAYAVVLKLPLKEVFPVKKFKAKDFFGSLFLSTGGVLLGLISVALVGMLYPKSLEGSDMQALNTYSRGETGYLFTIFVMAVMPAVCEEAIHRGAILANFRAFKKDWVAVLIMGLFFGIFHLSSLRFINTVIMGICLTYIVVKKNNILLSLLMHFLINFGSVSLSYLMSSLVRTIGKGSLASVQMTAGTMKTALGTYLICGIAAPFLIVIGLMLLDPPSHKKIRFLFAGLASLILLISAIAVISSNNKYTEVIVQTNMSYTVTSENEESSPVVFNIENEGDYSVAVVVMNSDGEYSVRIEKDNGGSVSGGPVSSGAVKVYSRNTTLETGSYKLYIISGTGTKGEKPVISVQINRI